MPENETTRKLTAACEPTLVIMAAGMGSRFGSLKQITPVDGQGHAIIDYSLFDAHRAGFERVVFVIKREIEKEFRDTVGARAEGRFEVRYVYQELERLPEGFSVPEGREKPWGTGHAAACCRGVVDGPFAVINADDFYGAEAYGAIYDFLKSGPCPGEHAMAGYKLRNTLTENGYVSRGVCAIEGGMLSGVTERTRIEKRGADAAWTEDGEHYEPISGDTVVSMNFWGFSGDMLDALWEGFPEFLREGLRSNPLRCEYFLPSVVNGLLERGRCSVRVLECPARWHGVTYREDLESVRESLARLRAQGVYPEQF